MFLAKTKRGFLFPIYYDADKKASAEYGILAYLTLVLVENTRPENIKSLVGYDIQREEEMTLLLKIYCVKR
jgi:hypothetical protein